MSRPAMAHGRQSRAIALRAASASIEANVTAFEVAAQLIADGFGATRRAAGMTLVGSHASTAGPARSAIVRRALG